MIALVGHTASHFLHPTQIDLSTFFENIENLKGNAFNIGGGIKNSLSLLELFSLLEDILHIEMNYKQIECRESDQMVFIANNTKIREYSDWQAQISPREGISKMVEWLMNR